MVQFVHCSDLHLDKSFSTNSSKNSYQRKLDLMNRFDEVVDFALRERIKLFLISGDIFDKIIPTNEALKFLAEKIKKLKENNIYTFLIGGNHDVPKFSIEKPMAIELLDSVGIANVFSSRKEIQSKILSIDNKEVGIHGKSFDPLDEKSNPFLGINPKKTGDFNLILLHGSYTESKVYQDIIGKINYHPFRKVDVEKANFNYIALGHYHNYYVEELPTGTIIGNPGSLERFTYKEKDEVKGFIFGDINNEETELEFIKVNSREMDIKNIILDESINNITEYIKIKLRELKNSDLLLRIKLEGKITLNQNNNLNLSSIIKENKESFFSLEFDRTDLEIKEYGKIFIGRIEKPKEAFKCILEEKIRKIVDEKTNKVYMKVLRKGLEYFEQLGE